MPYIQKNKEHAPITPECETYVPNILNGKVEISITSKTKL